MRTATLVRVGLFVVLTVVGATRVFAETNDFSAAIEAMERDAGGVIGVYAIDTETGKELRHRSNERFAVASTFKPLLVATVLAAVDNGDLSLSDELVVDNEKIVSYSPYIETIGDGESTTLADVSEAAVSLGDNTATNMLLELIGGPDAFTEFMRRIGDDTTRVDRYETELNANARGDLRDTSTPEAMAESLLRVLTSDVLSNESRLLLQDWMVASKTGMTRIRSGLPEDWRVGDKTGTGRNGAVNDIAVAWPPGRKPIVIAIYMSWSDADNAELGTFHGPIAALVADRFR
ncbi:MAG: class A beta-lactamase [Woeseiaceae bacterium]